MNDQIVNLEKKSHNILQLKAEATISFKMNHI